MGSLEQLIPLIFHERQEAGSMLCAQHALNSLLQEHIFTAPDLSDIARQLDALESDVNENRGTTSTNMDDTGFFSVQVLDKALNVWGLNLSRWRAENMKPYHDHPQKQLAFILNYQQHWYTIRRFGKANPNLDEDPGDGHWFNLNSFQTSPEWVSKLYLGMVLQQAEADGYSVFAVTQANPNAAIALPRTDADEVASTIPQPTSAPKPDLSRYTAQGSTTIAPSMPPKIEAGFEEEDYELQAALQASLGQGGSTAYLPPNVLRNALAPPGSGPSSVGATGTRTEVGDFDDDDDDPNFTVDEDDPVAASIARNKKMLEQEQLAQRELWEEHGGQHSSRRQQAEAEEAEMIRRAIEESERMARGELSQDVPMTETNPPAPSLHAPSGDRFMDDEDAELQAALRASLQETPEGLVTPVPSSSTAQGLSPAGAVGQPSRPDDDVSVISEDVSMDSIEQPSPAKAVDVDEMRRIRLAKFGGE